MKPISTMAGTTFAAIPFALHRQPIYESQVYSYGCAGSRSKLERIIIQLLKFRNRDGSDRPMQASSETEL